MAVSRRINYHFFLVTTGLKRLETHLRQLANGPTDPVDVVDLLPTLLQIAAKLKVSRRDDHDVCSVSAIEQKLERWRTETGLKSTAGETVVELNGVKQQLNSQADSELRRLQEEMNLANNV